MAREMTSAREEPHSRFIAPKDSDEEEGQKMPLGTQQQTLWQNILSLTLFLARLPVAILVIATAGCISFLGVMFTYRLTEFLFDRFLDHSW